MVKLSNFEILHPDKNRTSFKFSINIDQTKNETIIVIGHILGAPSLLADATVHKQTKIDWLADFIGKLWCNSLKTGEIKKPFLILRLLVLTQGEKGSYLTAQSFTCILS